MDRVTRKVTGVDTVCWTEPNPERRGGHEHLTADRGDVIELPIDQAERLEGLGFLVDPDTEVDDTGTWTPISDDDLRKLSVEKAVAYLGQTPEQYREDELERILDAEGERDRPRAGILSLDPDYEPDGDDADGDPDAQPGT